MASADTELSRKLTSAVQDLASTYMDARVDELEKKLASAEREIERFKEALTASTDHAALGPLAASAGVGMRHDLQKSVSKPVSGGLIATSASDGRIATVMFSKPSTRPPITNVDEIVHVQFDESQRGERVFVNLDLLRRSVASLESVESFLRNSDEDDDQYVAVAMCAKGLVLSLHSDGASHPHAVSVICGLTISAPPSTWPGPINEQEQAN